MYSLINGVPYRFPPNALSKSASGTRTATLTYDGTGRLLESGGGTYATTRYLYDGDELIAEYSPSGTLLRRYVHGIGVDDPLVWYEGSGTGDRRYLHADERGSIVQVTRQDGSVLATNSYDEWGVPATGNQGIFQYTGQLWLRELELYHYKARVYAPKLGRFLQTDPIGYEDGMNMYAYVGNDPVNLNDPTGTQDQKLDLQNERAAQRLNDEVNADQSRYNAGDPTGSDNLLSLDEANRHARYGEGEAVTVDASKMTVEVYADQESKTIDGRYGGQVQGAEQRVHGGVSVDYDPKTGRASIVSERYDFEQRETSTLRGHGRNIATAIGQDRSTRGGVHKTTPYTIHFRGQPKVIFVD